MATRTDQDRQAQAYRRARRWVRAFMFVAVVIGSGVLAGWAGAVVAVPVMRLAFRLADLLERRAGLVNCTTRRPADR